MFSSERTSVSAGDIQMDFEMRLPTIRKQVAAPLKSADERLVAVAAPLHIAFDTPLRIQLQTIQAAEPRGIFTVTFDNKYKVTGDNMAETVQVGHIGTIDVEWVDATGKPAKVDGPTTWQSTNPAVLTVTVSAGNPLIANWHTLAIGTAQIHASADADLGEGVKTVSSTTDFTVIQGEAVAGVTTVKDLGPGTPSGGGSPSGPGRAQPKR